jgi:hypothetical protein
VNKYLEKISGFKKVRFSKRKTSKSILKDLAEEAGKKAWEDRKDKKR